jgi:hypothetical protein
MKSFRQYISEAGKLYRFDDKMIKPKAQTYAFSPDGTGSGNVENNAGWVPPEDWERKKGLFAGQYHHVLSYAVPRSTRWLVTGKRTKEEKPTIHLSEDDREAINAHRPTISQYNVRQGFKKSQANGGEYFAQADTAPSPISQKTIEDPLEHIKQHFNVNFVPDLDLHRKNLLAQNIHHNSEGDFQ